MNEKVSTASLEHCKNYNASFKLDAHLMNELRREALRNDVSTNFLVNQILKKYVTWKRYETVTGMMPVPKTILSFVVDRAMTPNYVQVKDIESFSKTMVRRAAEIAFEGLMDLAAGLKAKVDLQTVLSVLWQYAEVCDIKCVSKVEGNRQIFIVRHNLGMGWSLFMEELISVIFQRLSEDKVEPKVMPNTLVFELPLKYVELMHNSSELESP